VTEWVSDGVGGSDAVAVGDGEGDAVKVAVAVLHVPSCSWRKRGTVHEVHTPVAHVAQLVNWQQRPAVQVPDVHSTAAEHAPPSAFLGRHWPELTKCVAAQAVHWPVVQVAQFVYWQQRPAVQVPDVHSPAAAQPRLLAFLAKHWPELR
jgi:hypothetical protein